MTRPSARDIEVAKMLLSIGACDNVPRSIADIACIAFGEDHYRDNACYLALRAWGRTELGSDLQDRYAEAHAILECGWLPEEEL